ncbi:hypothetical protein HF086_005198 [Spodoptera exigua]|uniref:Peptidase S1 domain-containing protein n=1 Tax=Spodoptera exigua TaxID=7107 RepID=A0A922MKQ8_SPOEX|nr:hypothetical protein HF086_005198 [Spodoptera exigua]
MRYNVRVSNDSNRQTDRKNGDELRKSDNERGRGNALTLPLMMVICAGSTDGRHRSLCDMYIDFINKPPDQHRHTKLSVYEITIKHNVDAISYHLDCSIISMTSHWKVQSVWLSLIIMYHVYTVRDWEGRDDIIRGDSGGPLQCRSGGRWELRGLTSFGSGCARRGVPDVTPMLLIMSPGSMLMFTLVNACYQKLRVTVKRTT